MGLGGWFKQFLLAGFTPASDVIVVTVKCNRCGELVSTRISINRDLSADYDNGGYICRKILTGSGLCFNKMHVEMQFNGSRRLVSREVSGGEFAEPPRA